MKAKPPFRSFDVYTILMRAQEGQDRIVVLDVPRPKHPGLKPKETLILLHLAAMAAKEGRDTISRTNAEIAQATQIPLRTVERLMGGDWILGGHVLGVDTYGKPAKGQWSGRRSLTDRVTEGGRPVWRRKPVSFSFVTESVQANLPDLATAKVEVVGANTVDLTTAKTAVATAKMAELSKSEKNYSSSSSLLASLEERAPPDLLERRAETPAEDDAWIDEQVPTLAKGEAPAEEQADNDPHAGKVGARFAANLQKPTAGGST